MRHGDPPADSGLHELTTAQLQLWTGQLLAPDSPMYNMAVAIGLDDRVDVACFRRAFSELVARCDSLRTTFQDVDGRAERVSGHNIGGMGSQGDQEDQQHRSNTPMGHERAPRNRRPTA